MSNKNKVSSVKKENKKDVKASKSAKKITATKAKSKPVANYIATKKATKNNVKPAKAKKIVKPISKVKAKVIAKKDIKPTKVKLVNKAQPKKLVAKKIIAKPVKKVIKKTVAKVLTKKAVKKVLSVNKKIVPKKIEKITQIVIAPIVKKELSAVKKVESTSKKVVLDYKTSEDVIALNNTIPIKKENQISLSKIASISSAITNPIKKTESYSVKPEKEPSGKFEIEFVIKASADLLYEFLCTQSGLSEWFCDDVNIRNGIYTFIWDGQMQQARLLKTIDHQLVRFQWVDKTDGSFFEFRLQHDDLTNDVSLMITDFADITSDRDSSKLLWQSQVEKLMHVVGSI